MAFVCTTNETGFRLDGFRSGQSYRCTVSVGYDDEKGVVYAAVIGIDPLPGMGQELYFFVLETETATGHSHEYWSGRDTGFIRKPSEREMVLASICEGLSDVLDATMPEELTWFSYDEAPPAKSLIKYDVVQAVVEASGMEVTRIDLAHGRVAWMARRVAR